MINLPMLYEDDSYGSHRSLLDIKVDSIDIFKQLLSVVIEKKIKPHFIKAYKEGKIGSIPNSIGTSITYDLSKITPSDFEKIFNQASVEESNGETIENLKMINNGDSVEFEFDIDCGRRGLHRENSCLINNRGLIKISLCELLEDGGIEDFIEEKLNDFLKN
jgi:hypothetical protein